MADDAQKLEEVQAVLKIKDYYQLLGVGKDADEVAIKNAYKKLALKFHPDKNKAQGAKEAFNKISNAYETLSNADKRANYDRYGSEQDLMQQRANRQRAYAQQQAQQFDHFNDIFMQFFAGMNDPNFRMQRRAYNFQQRPQAQEQGLRINFVPFFLLIVLLMSFLPRLFETKPYYSFEMTDEYKHRRHTSQLKTLFFARQGYFDYIRKGQAYREEIDRKVDEAYIRRVYQDCQQQKILKRRYRQYAEMYNRRDYEQLSAKVDLSNCNRLNYLQQNHAQYFQSLF